METSEGIVKVESRIRGNVNVRFGGGLTPCLRVSRCLPHQKKANKQWIWIAMDATTRQVIAFHVGDRSRESGKELWANIPLVYREQATFHTDQYEVYKGVIPAK